MEDFGRNLRDWLHELRRISSRRQACRCIASEPLPLRRRFPNGAAADAWLAAYAEHLATRIGRQPPAWAFCPSRVSPEPWFADDAGSPALRVLMLQRSPLPFKRRNLYTPSVELPLQLHAGRPAKSPEERRFANAARQHRFRLRRMEELAALRILARRAKFDSRH